MDIERIEELLRTRRPRELTYQRPMPAMIETLRPLRVTVRTRGGSPVGWTATAIALVLVVIAGTALYGAWRHGQPTAVVATGTEVATPTATIVPTTSVLPTPTLRRPGMLSRR